MSLSELRATLSKHGLHLRRELGQNFIVEEQIAERLAERAGVEACDCVIEVGTGLGMLTRSLAKRAKYVLSFEIDSGLARVVQEEGLLPKNVKLIHADVLKQDLGALIAQLETEQGGPVRLVANLPFSSATPLMRRLLDHRHQLVDWSVMLQAEVADRLFAPVGSRDYGSLAVLHHLCAELEGRIKLGAKSFFPVPKVDSAFVCVRASMAHSLAPEDLRKVERVARAAFGKRRKTLQNALLGGGINLAREDLRVVLEGLAIDPGARAETIHPTAFLALAKALLPGAANGAE